MIFGLIAISQTPTAPALLKKVMTNYRSLASYSDTVEIITMDGTTPWRQALETSFQRPGKWRFTYLEHLPDGRVGKCVLWSDGKKSSFWEYTSKKTEPVSNLPIGFGSMGMIGGDNIKIVPSLLDSKTAGDSTVYRLTKPTLLSDISLGGVPCYRLVGAEEGGSKLTLCIEKKRLLILRAIRDNRGVKTTATYKPITNPKLPPSTFNFVPPK